MKTTKLIALASVLSLVGFGCAKNSSQADGVNTTTAVAAVIIDPTAPSGSGSTVTTGGSTVTFTPVSTTVLSDYVATHPLNNPTNIRLNLNLSQVQSGRYAGAVTISYMDNGIQYAGIFKSGYGRNPSYSGYYDNNVLQSNYNYWFNFNSQLVFSGFFEDDYGAITVSLVPETTTTTSNSDAEPIMTTTYKGSIYYKNFVVASNPYVGGSSTATMAAHGSERACWFIYKGPYDCRSNVVQTKCGLNPGTDAGYKLLGTFTGLTVKSAFNIGN